mmetsp:Transcript_24835/g.42814  ORF Transcript_24835/g.42814 Transcript_24835/m.42814 type:complete len:321 (+) Transcript_24835:1080-2042(+)
MRGFPLPTNGTPRPIASNRCVISDAPAASRRLRCCANVSRARLQEVAKTCECLLHGIASQPCAISERDTSCASSLSILAAYSTTASAPLGAGLSVPAQALRCTRSASVVDGRRSLAADPRLTSECCAYGPWTQATSVARFADTWRARCTAAHTPVLPSGMKLRVHCMCVSIPSLPLQLCSPPQNTSSVSPCALLLFPELLLSFYSLPRTPPQTLLSLCVIPADNLCVEWQLPHQHGGPACAFGVCVQQQSLWSDKSIGGTTGPGLAAQRCMAQWFASKHVIPCSCTARSIWNAGPFAHILPSTLCTNHVRRLCTPPGPGT